MWPTLTDEDKNDVHTCVAEPGDLLYVPHSFYHQTLNLGSVDAITFDCDGGCKSGSVKQRRGWLLESVSSSTRTPPPMGGASYVQVGENATVLAAT